MASMQPTISPEDSSHAVPSRTTNATTAGYRRYHHHASSTSSPSIMPTADPKNHQRRFSIQPSTLTSNSFSSSSPNSQRQLSNRQQQQQSRSRQQTTTQNNSHTQSAATALPGPSPSFFRRIFKAFVGGNSSELQGYDPSNRKVHPLEGTFFDTSSNFTDQQESETQTNKSGSYEEYECNCGDQRIHANYGGMMATASVLPPLGQPLNSMPRHKKRSNSTVTTASVSSSYSQGGRGAKSSRAGRTASLGGDSVSSISSNGYGSCSGGVGNRRSSVTSSIAGESIHYDLGTNSKNRTFMNNSQQYRQHFTGHGGPTSTTVNITQQDIMKRRMSFFKSVAAGVSSNSRRESSFSTKSQETAVNLTGINPVDEPKCDDETEDMDLDDEDDEILNDYNDFHDLYNDSEEDENQKMDCEQDYYANHDSMLTADVELGLHRQQERAYLHSRRIRQLRLRRQSLLSDNNNLVFRNKTGACMVHPHPMIEREQQRPSPIQLPEILHLIFQFVVDMTPADDYSQREIYNCLLVSRQWYLVAQKTLWREIRLKNPDKLGLFIDLLKRTESVECLGIERNNQMQLQHGHQQRRASTIQYEQESIMAPMAMQKRLHERGSAVKKIVLHKLKLIEDQDILPLTTWFHNLQILEFYICEKLTDKIVVAVAENCPQLQQLLMPGCAKVTDVGISQIALHCPKMKHLDLRACSNVSDDSLLLVARHCPDLWHLNVGRVSSSSKVTGKSIVEIAKNTNLNTLGLAGCAMTDDAVIEIARYSRSGLHRISLNSCPLLTSASIRALMQLCPNLAVLEIKQCLLVTDMATLYRFSARRVLVELCPELQKRLLEYKVELSAMNANNNNNNNNNNVMPLASTAGQSTNQHDNDNNTSTQQQTTTTVLSH